MAKIGLAAAMAVPTIGLAQQLYAAEAGAGAGDGRIILAADLSDPDLLKQGTEQYNQGKYEEAVTSLQRVKKDSLSDAEKKQLDDVLAKADSAAKERMAPRVHFQNGHNLRHQHPSAPT